MEGGNEALHRSILKVFKCFLAAEELFYALMKLYIIKNILNKANTFVNFAMVLLKMIITACNFEKQIK